MKRPKTVLAAMVVQLALALLLAGITVYLLALTHSAEVLSEQDAADTVQGLKIGALVLGGPALLLGVGIFGMWINKLWGWCLAFVIDSAIEAALVYSVFEDGWRQAEKEDVLHAAGFAMVLVLMLLPGVVTFYWKGRSPPARMTP